MKSRDLQQINETEIARKQYLDITREVTKKYYKETGVRLSESIMTLESLDVAQPYRPFWDHVTFDKYRVNGSRYTKSYKIKPKYRWT